MQFRSSLSALLRCGAAAQPIEKIRLWRSRRGSTGANAVVLICPDQLNGGASMSLSDLASLGSFVSGFAVLTSLVYLTLQVRQTERNQKSSIRHSRVSRIVELHVALADP